MPRFAATGHTRPLTRFLCCAITAWLTLGCNFTQGESQLDTSALGQAIEQARLSSWRNLIAQSATLDERGKLQAVNDLINRSVSYASDQDVWGLDEYWATPLQTLTRGRGDCEDFAIGKYFTLVEMGVPSEKLRLTFVKALSTSQAHMVLAYYPSPAAQPLILDSLDRQIKPAGERRDLLPVYAFNDLGVFLAKTPQHASQPPQFLARWSELSERAMADGSVAAVPRG